MKTKETYDRVIHGERNLWICDICGQEGRQEDDGMRVQMLPNWWCASVGGQRDGTPWKNYDFCPSCGPEAMRIADAEFGKRVRP